MRGYTTQDVARMLSLSQGQVRSLARAGLLEPRRGRQGEHRFSFQDLVLLRTAKELTAAHIPPRQIRHALQRLREQLPSGRPLTAVQIAAEGDRVIVRDGSTIWNPESGQALFDFEVSELAEQVAPLAERNAAAARDTADEMTSEDWYELACDLELGSIDEARDAYRRALELDPDNVHARVNLGRLLHEAGHLEAAQAHYRIALTSNPSDPTAAFNLGVALEDLDHVEDAIRAYAIATACDPEMADGHFNLARLYEKTGDHPAALRHLSAYRQLTRRAAAPQESGSST
jgi:tetratricopeptide (TPR) repeat protein